MLVVLLYFLLPAAIANMSAALSAKLFPKLNFPLDFNKTFRGIRILGDHKTIRGFVFGIITATIVYALQIYLYNAGNYTHKISLINYNKTPFYLGSLLGLGAVGGDAVKSFFKRQLNKKPGKSWIPFDQIDWVAGALVITSWIVPYPPVIILVSLTICFLLHFVVKFIGYLLKLDNAPL